MDRSSDNDQVLLTDLTNDVLILTLSRDQARNALSLGLIHIPDEALTPLEHDDGMRAAAARWWATETQWRILDRCLQLHGGYGYINEYKIARLWPDSRLQRIYGDTNEITLGIVGKGTGF
jgi:alkylation response protein AidB-like acyl-CoA dehydrogenase